MFGKSKVNNKEERVKYPEVVFLTDFISTVSKFKEEMKPFDIVDNPAESLDILLRYLEMLNNLNIDIESSSLIEIEDLNNKLKELKYEKYGFKSTMVEFQDLVDLQLKAEELLNIMKEIDKIDPVLTDILLIKLFFRYYGRALDRYSLEFSFIFKYEYIKDRIQSILRRELEYLHLFNTEDTIYINSLNDILYVNKSLESRIEPGKSELFKACKELISDFLYTDLFSSIIENQNVNTFFISDLFSFKNNSNSNKEVKVLNIFTRYANFLYNNSKTSFVFNKLHKDKIEPENLTFMDYYSKYSVISDNIIEELYEMIIDIRKRSKAVPVNPIEDNILKYFESIIKNNDNNDDMVKCIIDNFYNLVKPFSTITSQDDLFRRFVYIIKNPNFMITTSSMFSSYLFTNSSDEVNFTHDGSVESKYIHSLFDKISLEDRDKLPNSILISIMFRLVSYISLERMYDLYDYINDIYDSLPLTLTEHAVIIRDNN